MEGEGQSESGDEDEPAVLWSVEVYDENTIRHNSSDRPYAIYANDKPLELSRGNRTKQTDRRPTTDSPVNILPEPTWTGCVFQVSCDALTNRHPRGLETGAIEALEFRQVLHEYIKIRSPFLWRTLKGMAGYYPDFFAIIRQADWAGATTVQPLDHASSPKIYEPWGILLHRFVEMKSFVDTSVTQDDSRDVEGSDAREQICKRLEKEHMRHLVEFLEPFYNSRVIPCIKALDQKNPQLAHSMLWYVFAPGTDVYLQQDSGSVVPCVIMSVSDNLAGQLKSHDRFKASRAPGWNLRMWNLDSDGSFIGRQACSYFIPFYSGTRALTSLNICPATIWDTYDKGERRQKILVRNRLVFESLQKGYLLAQYNGPIAGSNKHYSGTIVVDHKRGASFMKERLPTFSMGMDHASRFKEYDLMRVNEAELETDEAGFLRGSSYSPGSDYDHPPRVADYFNHTPKTRQPSGMLRDHNSGQMMNLPTNNEKHRTRYDSGSGSVTSYETYESEYESKFGERSTPFPSSITRSLSDHQLLLLRPRIRAFALKTKEWLVILPEGLQEVKQSEEGIENLVLGDTEMKTIKGLSKRQNSKRETWAADFIEGKGTGQIILLHGPPGVGKTYTVEATSEYLHRPLLSLTITDIGTMETNVERQLIKWFTLAEAWNAVLLVDEADIFLERRQNRDLARNGLVSAFLRRMEYFKGLLFLTTNRVGQIDDAFISRVHVAIGYEALTPESRSKIWQGFFRKLAKERAGKIQISPAARKWVLEKAISGEAQLNGRDIRNALQTAITLAEAECEEDPDFDMDTMTIIVDQSHFQRVLDITNKFQSYVQSIRREDEKKRAAGRYDRNDYYKDDAREERGF
ncbi:P-loop containing nucleoside triphosphate hydrolase protein [Apiospora kogelbergensis]|uniref:P-loop containing nucleoside triphosphate hydrolase protein n=1 Tax=Apiospora kogelbergensis TaxID=1337665 RepID=A0AAW0RET1_9PEZI